MSDAVADDFIAALDTILALGSRNYADQAPERTEFPYTVFDLDVSESPLLSGDGHALQSRRLHRVHLWEQRSAESPALRRSVMGVLDGLILSSGRPVSVAGVARVPDPHYLFVHRTFTVTHPWKIRA